MRTSTITIDHPHNEASALLGIQNRGLLESRNWEIGFWACSDEREGPKAVAALGRGGNGLWEVVPLRPTVRNGSRKRTEDCETLARAGSWVYGFGSQYGAKDGPLEPKRHFVFRFNEALIEPRRKTIRAKMDVARRPFILHRLINDALTRFGVSLLPPDEELRDAMVSEAKRQAEKKKKKWRDRVHESDAPINVEGSTFLPGGHLLLGLRYPVTRHGHPILVEVEGIDRVFEKGSADPEVIGMRILENVGSAKAPAGIRELDNMGGYVHALTGSLDSKPGESAILGDAPEAARAVNEHWRVPLKSGARGPSALKAELLRRFDNASNIEGIALDGERIWYAHDAEKIVLEVADLK